MVASHDAFFGPDTCLKLSVLKRGTILSDPYYRSWQLVHAHVNYSCSSVFIVESSLLYPGIHLPEHKRSWVFMVMLGRDVTMVGGKLALTKCSALCVCQT